MNIVHVGAHQDDEGRSLGTLIKYRQQGGHKITFICTTNGDKGLSVDTVTPYKVAAATRDREMHAVAAALGADYICLGAEDEFLYDTKEMRLRLIDALRASNTDLIFTHYVNDYNLDHTTTSTLVFQESMNSIIASIRSQHPALKVTPKIFYSDPGPGFGFEGTHFVELSEEVLQEKARIISLHESQNEAYRQLFGRDKDITQGLIQQARQVGARVGVTYAEVFRPCLASRRTPLANLLP